MTYTILSVTITEWITYYGTRYLCSCFADYNGAHGTKRLDHATACKLMWKLIKRGGTKTLSPNPYTPRCSTVEVRLLILD